MTAVDTRSSVDKAFSILRAFTTEDTAGVGVSELARRASLSKSTAHRLLSALVQNGAVQRSGEVYRLGSLFTELNKEETTRQADMVSEVLTPFLAALFERTRHTVHLGYLIGTDVSYANKLFSTRGVTTPSRIGGLVPGYATGVGKAIMAYDENLIKAAINKGLTKWTPNTIDDPDEFHRVLTQVRQEGIAYDREEISLGLSCVAAPVFGRGPVPVAAMSLSSSTADFHPEDHIPTLKRITAAASKAFAIAARDLEEE
ncbi:Transcriptional regulator KdgR [Corynebacterium occultum]|uniref:Transcriptional regulator KdgR n=1 Tax=Corynebacterium occultum TaxID=2675219 RepID=A0A6B8W2Y2_9CORY|nr:IclR family transcriptional regulator [Corynebacterium occultum]QGU06831.1 Transcriptional regulator KdgR [Corynebacterium occultum]